MTQQIGRFEIRRELGRGSQSVVYLAWDPQLQREVAIKTLHFDASDATRNATLLAEARTVSPLRHPHILPIFDVGEADGDPYLVFEYVDGLTLDQQVRTRGALDAVRSAEIAVQVLDGLAYAHAQRIIHRDLKPSNILIDPAGKARVMDFGIAMRIDRQSATGDANLLVGTPAYLSPEYVTAQRVTPQGDIYAVGLILLEMLSGQRVIRADSLPATLFRIANEAVQIPAELKLEDAFAHIVLRACAHDPAVRYADAGEMRKDLQGWLDSSGRAEDDDANSAAKQSTLAFLLRRMRHKSDFPALSDSVAAINKLTSSDRENISHLSNTILRDYALTNKILRIANAAHYRQSGGGQISTVSRAVVVLGFDAIRNIAITVLLFEHMQDKGNVKELREAFLRANLAGIIGRETSKLCLPRTGEEAFICSLFQSLGELLAQFYFPEESEQVRRLLTQKELTLEHASTQVLGLSFEELGIGIARSWGFPNGLVNSMRSLPRGAIRKSHTHEEGLRLVAGFANEMCDLIAGTEAAERSRVMASLNARFSAGLQMSVLQTRELILKASQELADVAAILHVNLKQSPFANRLRSWTGEVVAANTPEEAVTALTELGAGAEALDFAQGDLEPDAQAILAAGIQEISNSLVEEVPLNDLLRIILETIYRAMGFEHVLLCLRDGKANAMVGRFGFGPDAMALAKQLRFTLMAAPDVFHVALSKGADVIIDDTDDAKIADRIPDWHRQNLPGHTFVLLPLLIKSVPVAMIYCSKSKAGSIHIPEKELSLLKTLRNQAVLAIKQAQH